MDFRPMEPREYSADTTLARVRRCAKCGGEMHVSNVLHLRVNGGSAGQSYTYVCRGCKEMVTELSAGRIAFQGFLILCGGGLGAMLVYFGTDILIGLIQHGPGGNDVSALVVVLVLFLGIGLPFLLFMLWLAKDLIADFIKLQRSPVIR